MNRLEYRYVVAAGKNVSLIRAIHENQWQTAGVEWFSFDFFFTPHAGSNESMWLLRERLDRSLLGKIQWL